MHSDAELPFISAVDALAAFRARDLSPVELLDAVLAQAERVEPQVNALVVIRREAAYAAAREAEARYAGRGDEPRPLEGLPVAVKEEQPIAGEPLIYGSRTLAGHHSDISHPIVDRIQAAGGVIHVRTATPEFSCAGFTHSDVWGVTRNPWNPEFTPGGSSGGSGASLASGTCVLATGSDIGGSIRIPASFCGVVGYKPPYGRVPALPPFNLDAYCHDGPMARSVADVALFHNVIAGQDAADPASLPFPGPISVDGAAARVAGKRIAWARTIGDAPVEPDVAAGVAAVAGALAALGAVVEEVEIDIPLDLLFRAALTHYGSIMGPSIEEVAPGRDQDLMQYTKEFRDRSAAMFREVGFYAGLGLEGEIDARFRRAVTGFDSFLCPTVATLGYRAGDSYSTTRAVVAGTELDFYLEGCLTPLFNVLSRRPVMAMPSGLGSNGVPTGVQVVAPNYDDVTAFDVAAAIETTLPRWSTPDWRPPLVRGG